MSDQPKDLWQAVQEGLDQFFATPTDTYPQLGDFVMVEDVKALLDDARLLYRLVEPADDLAIHLYPIRGGFFLPAGEEPALMILIVALDQLGAHLRERRTATPQDDP